MCFGYNPCMVALTNITADFPQTALRGRAQNHRYRLGAEHCSKFISQANLRKATYGECKRLGSCSKDPIGFEGGAICVYEFVSGRALAEVDPSGLSIPVSPGWCGSTNRVVTATVTQVTCLFDVPGWFGPRRRRVTVPATPGISPASICLAMKIDGFAGYQLSRKTTKTTYACKTPCAAASACLVVPNPAAATRCILLSVGMVVVSTTPNVKVHEETETEPISEPIYPPLPPLPPPPSASDFCRCATVAGNWETEYGRVKSIEVKRVDDCHYPPEMCVGEHVQVGDKVLF
jgi:hypothetical protein